MNENPESNKPKVSIGGIIFAIVVIIFLMVSYNQNKPSSSGSDGGTNYTYEMTIDSATKKIDFPDNCVRIGYTFKNNSGSDKSFGWAFDTKVYQNGIELSETFGSVDTYTDIQSGRSIRVYEEYVVRNLFDDVEVVVYRAGTDKEVGRKVMALQNPQ
ncbi:MAG: DUF5067 domain-containing protein [Huintestinicola sp.]|uniref:DUF5067 domain-containing protein n=1 Tax=Huintestinicola sp. TaxID=2981661 RepID=UPI003EFC8EB3